MPGLGSVPRVWLELMKQVDVLSEEATGAERILSCSSKEFEFWFEDNNSHISNIMMGSMVFLYQSTKHCVCLKVIHKFPIMKYGLYRATQDPGTPCWFPKWMAGAQVLELPFDTFPDTAARSWVESRASGTQTGTLLLDVSVL